ncbi:hypothetical protein PCO31111_04628 [Pandoraea communis]|uniref:DUF2523 domain-containing protein n=1 Tax=Pandoraea communis TaxID=2508297 RepID=A0A5E4YKU8_9BURK|nr:DUF2523 family protein [Pandoraea communis]VVE00108.1 hypothetical protein PCO31110_02100 [Pandoraea communis]VVE49371.1 hypothetical protein PCO31111_04628 [Pandoraea communis]
MPLFAIIASVLNTALGFMFRASVVKWATFFALWYVVSEFVVALKSSNLFPQVSKLNEAFSGIPTGVWYWLDLFAVSQGAPMIISAMAARFLIRRLPIIG